MRCDFAPPQYALSVGYRVERFTTAHRAWCLGKTPSENHRPELWAVTRLGPFAELLKA